MMLRYTFNDTVNADRIEKAVAQALEEDHRTADIYSEHTIKCSTVDMGNAIVGAMRGQE